MTYKKKLSFKICKGNGKKIIAYRAYLKQIEKKQLQNIKKLIRWRKK